LALAWGADSKLAEVTVRAAVTKYFYAADDARALKAAPQASGPANVTVFLGPDVEVDTTGKAEWTNGEANPRFIVTNIHAASGPARFLYEDVYCQRGEMENRRARAPAHNSLEFNSIFDLCDGSPEHGALSSPMPSPAMTGAQYHVTLQLRNWSQGQTPEYSHAN
jgi:hypothetical protein